MARRNRLFLLVMGKSTGTASARRMIVARAYLFVDVTRMLVVARGWIIGMMGGRIYEQFARCS